MKLRMVNSIRDKLSVHVAERVRMPWLQETWTIVIPSWTAGKTAKGTEHCGKTHFEEKPSY